MEKVILKAEIRMESGKRVAKDLRKKKPAAVFERLSSLITLTAVPL